MGKFSFATAAACAVALLLLAGCYMKTSFTYETTNDGKIIVTMTVGDGYSLTNDGNTLIVEKDGDEVLTGFMISKEKYESSRQILSEDTEYVDTILAEPADAPTLYVFQYDMDTGRETDFLLSIDDSDYAFVFMSFATYDEAKAAFDRISFEMRA